MPWYANKLYNVISYIQLNPLKTVQVYFDLMTICEV